MAKAKIYYVALDDFWRKEEKLTWLRENPLSRIAFDRIEPDSKNNWINQTDNDWDSLLPLVDKDVKAGKSEKAIFKLFSYGFDTKRDDYVYSFDNDLLKSKIAFFIDEYNKYVKDNEYNQRFLIKWSRNLERDAKRNIFLKFSDKEIITSDYRPFTKKLLYFNKHLISENFQWLRLFINNQNNLYIAFSGLAHVKPFQTLAVNMPHCGDFLEKTQSIPLYRFNSENHKYENITDWALAQFREQYTQTDGTRITKKDIFYYTYGVLYSPAYRKKYEQNLKREFPRLPFYADFFQWRDWGKELIDLHINYETVEPYNLQLVETDLMPKKKFRRQNSEAELFDSQNPPAIADDTEFVVKPRTKLRADKTQGIIELDTKTSLTGVPTIAWEYKLGNRSALEWVLDQYKERTPSDPTIRERFNTYKFEDYKDHVIDLLKRVCSVSVRTMEIINQMPGE